MTTAAIYARVSSARLRMTIPSGPTVLGRIPAVVATLWLLVGLEMVAVSG